MTLDEITFASDITVSVSGIEFVHAKNISHLTENCRIDVIETDDGPDFLVTSQDEKC